MRTLLCAAAAALLAPVVTYAQDRPYQEPDPLEYGRKEILVNKNSENYKNARVTYLDLDKTTQAKADTFNQQADKLADERELWLARYRIYENVISLRGKDKVMTALDEARKKLGVSELEGYQRLGVHNPFSGESYLKYYDAKSGELVIAEVRQLYKNLEAARTDFAKSSSRLRVEENQISKSYQDSLDKYKAARDAKMALEKSQAELTTLRNQLAAAEAQRATGGAGGGGGGGGGGYRVIYQENIALGGQAGTLELGPFGSLADARRAADQLGNRPTMPYAIRILDGSGKRVD